MKLAMLVLAVGLGSAIALAAIFSGSVAAPLTSMPVAGCDRPCVRLAACPIGGEPMIVVWVVFAILVVPAALLGQWIGYHACDWIDRKLTGRPSEQEVARRLMQLELDRVARRGDED